MTAGVYLVRAENGLVKIGHSSHVEHRVAGLRTGTPLELSLILVIETKHHAQLETARHTRFAAQRRRGEWFELSEDDIIAAKGFPVPKTPRARPAARPPEAASPPPVADPPTTARDRIAQRLGRAMDTACRQVHYYQSQGQTAEAERWQMIADRLFEDAERWVRSGKDY